MHLIFFGHFSHSRKLRCRAADGKLQVRLLPQFRGQIAKNLDSAIASGIGLLELNRTEEPSVFGKRWKEKLRSWEAMETRLAGACKRHRVASAMRNWDRDRWHCSCMGCY